MFVSVFVSVSPRSSSSSSRAAREGVREIRNFAVKNSIFILDMDYLAFSESKSSDLFKYINTSKKIFYPFFSIFALFFRGLLIFAVLYILCFK